MSHEIPGKLRKYVVTDLPKYVEVTGHHNPVPFWIAPGMFPGLELRVAGSEASKIAGATHADPHVHAHPEVYLAPSEDRGAILVEIEMDEERFLLESPFAVFIPAGVSHCF
ncbi:MAG: hypothetical protein ABII06_13655, partial [Pseudomonadota bacterium]